MDKALLESIRTELVLESKLKQPSTPRVEMLRKTLLDTVPAICSERANLLTESWKETEAQPVEIRRAKALEKILGEMSIFIRPGELIVGNQASSIRAAPVFPEFAVEFILDELDGKPYHFHERPADKFVLSEDTAKDLREVANWWRGKTMNDHKLNLLTREQYEAGYEVAVINLQQHGENGGAGHMIPDYPKAIYKGLNSIIKETEEKLNRLDLWAPDALDKKSFWEAAIISLRAVINFAERFAALAREMAKKESDPERKAELEKIAKNCDRVPGNPARTFWEAIQSLWFCHLIVQIESNGHSISYGRFDQYMYPFYEKDITEGRLTPEAALELIECLLVKSTEVNKLRSWAATVDTTGYGMFQQLTVGGQDAKRESAVNDLSWLTLEAQANMKLPQPSISVRYWNGIPEDFLMKCCEVINIHRGGQPSMYNDEVIIPCLLGVDKVALEEAYDYAIEGCVEAVVSGKSKKMGVATVFNALKCLELTLNNGRDPRTGIQLFSNLGDKDLTGFKSFDELMMAYKRQCEHYTGLSVGVLNIFEKTYAELTPVPFVSTLIYDCIGRGKDVECGGALYSTANHDTVGWANAGNSLSAIKKLVFEEGRLTASELLHALETDFEDNSTTPTGVEIQQMLLAAPKFGNDDDYVDLITKEAEEFVSADMPNYTDWLKGPCACSISPVTFNIFMGDVCMATPDGRKAHVPVNDGCSPVRGTDIKGPTAAVKSAAKLAHIRNTNGTIFNQKFSPLIFKDLSGLRKLSYIIRTYFELKGWEMQVNIVSAETLRDAQKHPERYQDLMVRVAGYSALFTPLSRELQEDIIMRTEQSM
jgi:pyruvate formate-lyase/glycerol dehydratase family glycyl radical enzyme